VVERGAFRLGPVDVALGWADRVVITGANGSGKTTLHLRHTYRVTPRLGTG
jgi:ABC-type siderophore export system fused ATPase/permease subunit